jgi:hypothetical protein
VQAYPARPAVNGSKTRQALKRTNQAHAEQVRREEWCVGHVWRYAPVSQLPGYRPRRTCTLCDRVEWLTESQREEAPKEQPTKGRSER